MQAHEPSTWQLAARLCLSVARPRPILAQCGARAVVPGAPLRRLKIVAGGRDTRYKYGALAAAVHIGVQPLEEERHIVPQLTVRRLGPYPQYSVAIRLRMQQNLLNEERRGVVDHVWRSTAQAR